MTYSKYPFVTWWSCLSCPTPIQRLSNAGPTPSNARPILILDKSGDNLKMAQASHISLWASLKDSKGCAPLFLRKASEKCRAMVPTSGPHLGTTHS